MKKRFMSAFLAVIMLFSMLSTTAFAASSEEEALGEINIFNGGVTMSYLSINGRIREQIYTYYNRVTPSGAVKEIPAYCVNPNDKGVPQTVGVGESIKYLADEKAADPKVTGIIANGYPNRGLSELGLENKYHAYYATKMALWCYLLSHWDINNLKVNPNLTGLELERAQKILAAAKDIYRRGTTWTENLSPNVSCTPDRDVAYEVTVNGRQYKQQVFTVTSKTWVCDYKINVAFTDPASVPSGTRIVDMNNNDISTLTTSATGEGYSAQFKVLYPSDSVAGQTGSVQLSFDLDVYQYAIFYASVVEVDKYGNTPLSALVVFKFDSVTGEAVKNAVFQVKYLTGTSGTGGTVIGTYKTSANGSFTVTGLDEGTYIVEELASDSGHVIDTAPQTAYISGKDQDVVELYFGNSPKGALLIKKIDSVSREPLSDVEFFVTTSDGTVVGNANGKFVTDSAGTVLIENIDPGTTLVVKETRTKDNTYILDDTPQTARIKAGQTVTLEFRNQPKGNLIINKQDSVTKEPLEGVQFKITYADGRVVDADGGQLSSNGLYWTDKNGQIKITGITGTIVTTEMQSIPGYTIHEETRSQTVVVNTNDTQSLYFYNDPIGGVEIIKVNADKKTERIPNVKFEIRRADDGLVDTVTTDKNGRAFLSLEDGHYYAVEIKSADGFELDSTPHYFEVKDGKTTTLTVENKSLSGILIHKIDSNTGEGIYGVTFLLYDSNKTPIGQYESDQDGWVYITGLTESGRYYIRELENEGYNVDTQMKTVYVSAGRTVEIEWENEPITGQIQIYKYAGEYNEITGTAPGTPLKGAVYEIINARSGKVVDYITTDSRGVAASKPLPLTRYQIREVSAPAYWQVSAQVFDVTLEYAGQIIKLNAYDKTAELGVSITKRGNAAVLAGNQMRYDITVANTSNVDLESFYWHDRIPTDVARATTLTTGTYSARLNYRILYKTNYTANYQVLASNLLTSNNYSFALNAIPMQAGEVITDIYFDFGKVPVGFQSVSNPTLSVMVNGNAVNGYYMTNRADVGGKYLGTWQTANASWVTIIQRYGTTLTLPKTGY